MFCKKAYLFLALFICLSTSLFSQGLTSEQQVKVDSLMQWIKAQSLSGKPVDQKKIDSANASIRAMYSASSARDTLTKGKNVREITKQSTAGSTFTVPAGKVWNIKRVYVSDGGTYNVLVTFKAENPYKAGDKITAPSYSASAELLNGEQVMMNYIFKIEESDIAK